MLAIKFKLSKGFSRTWHIGELMPVSIDSIEDIVMIQADGDELTHIINQYTTLHLNNTIDICTIPLIPNIRVMRWCGSIAQTIIANLCS